ncbi:hypothetical protein AVEN_253954-1, partial [Araneus ventricosus]
ECLNLFKAEIMDKGSKFISHGRSVLLRRDPESPESMQLSDKLCKSFGKNPVQQMEGAHAKFSFEKFKNQQKHKTSRQIYEKMKKLPKESYHLPGKSKLRNIAGGCVKLPPSSSPKKIDERMRRHHLPDKSNRTNLASACVKLPRFSSGNKIEHQKCNGTFGNSTLGKTHHSNCKSTKRFNYLKGCKNNGRRCEKCHFNCISPILFQEHDCEKVLERMKRCAVRLNVLKLNSVVGRVVIRECQLCKETFEQQFTERHFELNHPGERSFVNFNQYYLKLPSIDSEVVKTEPVAPVPGFVGSAVQEPDRMKTCAVMRECEFCNEMFDEHFTEQHFKFQHPRISSSGNFMRCYANINAEPFRENEIKTEPVSVTREWNPVLYNISVPPPPVNLPAIQSSVSLATGQSPLPQTGEIATSYHSASGSAMGQSPSAQTGEPSSSNHQWPSAQMG